MIAGNNSDTNPQPVDYTAALGRAICHRLVEGESLHAICSDPGMPSKATVSGWLARHEVFRKEYGLAKRFMDNCFEEELIEIADECGDGWVEKVRSDGRVVTVAYHNHIARCWLRIDVRCWVADQREPNNPVKYSIPRKGRRK
jgi:hypothetical protein